MKSSEEIEFPLMIYDTRDLAVLLVAPLMAFWLALTVFAGSLVIAALLVPAYFGFQVLLHLPPRWATHWEIGMADVLERLQEARRS